MAFGTAKSVLFIEVSSFQGVLIRGVPLTPNVSTANFLCSPLRRAAVNSRKVWHNWNCYLSNGFQYTACFCFNVMTMQCLCKGVHANWLCVCDVMN